MSGPSTLTPSSDLPASPDTAGGKPPVSMGTVSRYGPVAAVCGITGLLGLFRLGTKSFWTDEAFSYAMARLDLPTMGRVLAHGESFNGLYYTLLHFWQFGGNSETWLRLPSVIFGVLAASFMFALNRRLFGMRVALLAAGFLAVNAFFVYYEQDARSYSLAVCLVVLATYLFAGAVEDPSMGRWLAYGVVAALAVYAHLFSAFVLVAHLSSLAIRRPRPRLQDLAAGYGLMASLLAPLVVAVLSTDSLEREFIDHVHLGSFRWLFLNLTGGGGLPTTGPFLLLLAYFGACCLGLVWMLRAAISRTQDRGVGTVWSYGLVLSWLIVPILGSFAISLVRAPIFYPRYLIVALPPLVTIAAIGIAGLPRPTLRAIAFATIVALAIPPLLSNYRADFKEGEDWRRAVAHVARGDHPGDAIVFLSRYGRRSFEYYLERFPEDTELEPVYPDLAWGTYVPVLADLHVPWSTAAAAERLRSRFDRVWVVLIWGGFDSGHEDAEPLRIELRRDYVTDSEQVFGSQVLVRLYQKSNTDASSAGS